MRRPILLLYSGNSLGEAWFLERMRWWIIANCRRMAESTGRGKPNRHHVVWILYPHPSMAHRFAMEDFTGYEEWEIRPVRRDRPLLSAGFFPTVAAFQQGAWWCKTDAPWKYPEFIRKRQPVAIYMAPTLKDINWMHRHLEKWKHTYNIPKLFIGAFYADNLPAGFHRICDGVVCLTKETQATIFKATPPGFPVITLPWKQMWAKEEDPAYDFGLAMPFRDRFAVRNPVWARDWIPEGSWKVSNTLEKGFHQDLAEATSCRYYMVGSQREGIPWDAMIALARGATLVAPDAEPFRRIAGNKILYPVGQGPRGGPYRISTVETRIWVQNRLRRRVS